MSAKCIQEILNTLTLHGVQIASLTDTVKALIRFGAYGIAAPLYIGVLLILFKIFMGQP
jgi:hypothetical protein